VSYSELPVSNYLSLIEMYAYKSRLPSTELDFSNLFDDFLEHPNVKFFDEPTNIDDQILFRQVWWDWLDLMLLNDDIHPLQHVNYTYQGKHKQMITGHNRGGEIIESKKGS